MYNNKVWNSVQLSKGTKLVGCKWIFKTKQDSLGKVEHYKVKFVIKGFTHKEGIDYAEKFFLVSMKYLFKVIMTLVAQFLF